MNKKNSLLVLIGIIAVLFFAWLAASKNPDAGVSAELIMAIGLAVICVFLIVDTLVDYKKNRPKETRKKYTMVLTVGGSFGVLCYLVYFIIKGV